MSSRTKKSSKNRKQDQIRRNKDEDNNQRNMLKRDYRGFSPESDRVKVYQDKGYKICTSDQSYQNATKRLQQRNGQTNPLLYMCGICQLYFSNPKRYLIHYKWHRWEGAPEKRLKKKRKPPENDIALHMEKYLNVDIKTEDKLENEEGEESFVCNMCHQTYLNRRRLQSHKFRVHFATPCECAICHKTFNNKEYLNSHMTSHSENRFTCTECPKTFKFVHSLQRHIPTHYAEKNFSCEECGKSFGSDLLLKIHSKTHAKPPEKTYQCSFCPKAFYQMFSLQAHERVHTGDKPFPCQLCDQKYPSKSSLIRHIKVSHSTDLPYPCELCGRSFHVRSALEYHIRRSHYKERPYPCPHCENKYNCQSELYKHQSKVHPGQLTVAPVESRLVCEVSKEPKEKSPKKKKRNTSENNS